MIDGDGNFDVRKIGKENKLKAIRIKIHDRDMRILTRIRDMLHIGRIRSEKKKPYSTYVVSKREEMERIMNEINGKIRVKAKSFKKACESVNIKYKEADYRIKQLDPYLAFFCLNSVLHGS